jgi:hypothetical protein
MIYLEIYKKWITIITIEEMNIMEKKLIKCKFCNHEWKSGSEMIWVCCPCCQKKSRQREEIESLTNSNNNLNNQ